MENREYASEKANPNEEPKTTEIYHTARKLEATGWALFFIWVGIAFLANLGLGLGLLGIGIITLAVQIARRRYDLKLQSFWVIIGLLFTVGGLWDLFKPRLPLVPILLIIAGLILLLWVATGKRYHE